MRISASASEGKPTNGLLPMLDSSNLLQLKGHGPEFAHSSRKNSPLDNKLIIDCLANLAHRPGENPRKFMSRLEKLFNTLHENYASYRIKPECPAPIQPQGTYTQDMLTAFANNNVRAYNKFLLAQVFRAAAPENVRKLLSHKDQTRMMVDDAYDSFFTDHGVETDKKERAMVNVINEEEDSSNTAKASQLSGHSNANNSNNMCRKKLQLQEQPEPATEG
jgi:hypothetical protein